MQSINFQFFIEHDANPFILFNNQGKIKYLNNSAEILMGSVTPKELFELAVAHAPQTFGFKKSILNLNFNSFAFYGINVLYENEEFIGIHLYNKAIEHSNQKILLDGFSLTDINVLLQANLELFNINYNGSIELLADYDIPKFQIHQNNFSLFLRKVLSQFSKSKKLKISVKIKLGEQVVLKGKKYAIIVLELQGQLTKEEKEETLSQLAERNFITMQVEKNRVILEIPAIR
jgi:hypothetical protein